MRAAGLVIFAGGLAVTGCSFDTKDQPDTGVSDSGTADSGAMDSGTADSGGSADLRADLPPPDGGAAPSDASAGAIYFCNGYKSACGFGSPGYYADMATCLKLYDSYSFSRISCVANELGKKNCKGAAGAAPCDKD
jgi:hypothetical protein